jgi:uncharacterized protein YukE
MALDPPSEVVQFLQFIGVSWPSVNEDTVRDVAGYIQEFADNLKGTHQDATNTIQQMGEAYQAASYDTLVQRWAEMSSTHMTELLTACQDVVTALHAAADYIVAMKVSAIAELVGLAAAFVADQAAAVATFGLAKAAAGVLGVPSGPAAGAPAGTGYAIHPEMLRGHAATMRTHADTAAAHATTLAGRLSGVTFT